MSGPVGYVLYGGGSGEAVLLGKDRWRVTVEGEDRPELARGVVAMFRGAYRGPQDGYYGQRILEELAAALNGVAVVAPREPSAPDTVY